VEGSEISGGVTEKEATDDDPLSLAVTITVLTVVAPITFSENAVLVWPAGTITESGLVIVTPVAAIPIERLSPGLGAEAVKVTVQFTVAGAVTKNGKHWRPIMDGSEDAGGVTVKDATADDPFSLPVTNTVLAVMAPLTLSENTAMVWPAGTVTEPGLVIVTLVAAVPIETLTPGLGAEAVRVTVQVSTAGPVTEVGEHWRALTCGIGVATVIEVVVATGIEALNDDTPSAFMSSIPGGTPTVLGESCNVATATTPFGILLVLRPLSRQLSEPYMLRQVSDFDADVA